jgi:hypothetical protein
MDKGSACPLTVIAEEITRTLSLELTQFNCLT